MEIHEVILRVIGILTESKGWIDQLQADVEADVETDGSVMELLSDVFPSVTVPANASAEQVAKALTGMNRAAVSQLVVAFSFLFSELADVHDAGRTDIKSSDLLRELALRFSNPSTE